MTPAQIALQRVLIRNSKHLLSVLKTMIEAWDTYLKAQSAQPIEEVENADPLEHFDASNRRP